MAQIDQLKNYLLQKNLTAELRGDRWVVITSKGEVRSTGATWSLAVLKAITLDPDHCPPH